MGDTVEAPAIRLTSSERISHFRGVWVLWIISAGAFLLVSQAFTSLIDAVGVPGAWALITGLASFVVWLLVLARLYRRFDFRTERNVELANEETHRLQFVMYPFNRFLVSRLVVRHNGDEVPVERLSFRRVDQARFRFGKNDAHDAQLFIDERVGFLSFRFNRPWRLTVDGNDLGAIE